MNTQNGARTKCRVCASPLTVPFADLRTSPIANNLVKADEFDKGEYVFPLNAMVCEHCWLVQLTYSHPADQLFTASYPYFSSYSRTWLEHSAALADTICDRFNLGPESFLVEVASNDGYLLQFFKQKGLNVLGVEPSSNTAAVARTERGIETTEAFFNRQVGAEIACDRGFADFIVANNVIAHVPELPAFLEGFEELLAKDGVASFEFPYLGQLMKMNQFDTIYHEHYSYFSLLSASHALESVGLRAFDVQQLSTHGGSLRLFVCHADSELEKSPSLKQLEIEELNEQLDTPAPYLEFQERVDQCKRALLRFLCDAREAGKRVVAYGAPAKGNTLLNYCGIGCDLIEYTVDISPHKQGTFLPGSRIPVDRPERIRETRPDYVLILPWNLLGEISSAHSYIAEWGGRFVTPIPEVVVH